MKLNCVFFFFFPWEWRKIKVKVKMLLISCWILRFFLTLAIQLRNWRYAILYSVLIIGEATSKLYPVLGPSVHERHGHSGGSPTKGYQGDEGLPGAFSCEGRLRELGLFSVEIRRLRGAGGESVSLMCTKTWRNDEKIMEPGSSSDAQWWEKRQCAQTGAQEAHSKH